MMMCLVVCLFVIAACVSLQAQSRRYQCYTMSADVALAKAPVRDANHTEFDLRIFDRAIFLGLTLETGFYYSVY